MIIAPSGGKWWRIKYRFDGKNKTLSIGTYPKVSLNEARALRDDLREMVRQGINPSSIRKAEKAERRQEKMEQDIRKAADRKQSINGGVVSVHCAMDSPIEIWKGGNRKQEHICCVFQRYQRYLVMLDGIPEYDIPALWKGSSLGFLRIFDKPDV